MRTILFIAAAMFAFASVARADIYQWEYIDPADPSQGKRQSTTLAPDGAGVDAVPGADLSNRDLTMADLRGADFFYTPPPWCSGGVFGRGCFDLRANLSNANLTNADLSDANLYAADLSDANFTGAEVHAAKFYATTQTSTGTTGFTATQLYSTASYRAKDLSAIGLGYNNLAGWNFAGQDLTSAVFQFATLIDADFTGARVQGAFFRSTTDKGFSAAQLYSTASYQARDLTGIDLAANNLNGWNFSGQRLTNAHLADVQCFYSCSLAFASLNDIDFSAADLRGTDLWEIDHAIRPFYADAITANTILPYGHIDGLDLDAGGLLVVHDYDGGSRYYPSLLIPISVEQHMTMSPDGTLKMVFEADPWDSTISFAPGIPVTLGGALELTFADGVNLAGQRGRTIDLFDWTDVSPTGTFEVSSPYDWDLSNLYTTGEVTLVAIPEPATLLLLTVAAGATSLLRWITINRARCSALSIACGACLLATPSSAFGEFNLLEATIPQMQAAMESGATTSEDLVRKYLQRIANLDDAGPMLNSTLALNPGAIETARVLDQERLATGARGPLHGIPILLKDNIDTFDMPTTGGTLILANSVPPDDAFLVQKLRAAGAVILGKNNLSELAGFVSTNMPAGFSAVGGLTRNPYGPGVLTPSGSSSGSAVSVAANLAAAAVGTETQGSIVFPAAHNSVVGIRPTVGLISRHGTIPISYTQDTAGPLARTVADAAIMLGAMAGVDPNDPRTLASVGHSHSDYTQFLNADGLQGKRIGIVRDPDVFTVDPTQVPLMDAAIDAMEQGGAVVLDHIDFSANVIALAELWGTSLPKVQTYEFVPGIEGYLASLGENAPAGTLAEIIAFNTAHAPQAIPFGQNKLQASLATGGDLNDPAYIAQRDEAIRLMGEDGIDVLLETNDLDALLFPSIWSNAGSVPGYPAVQVPAGFNEDGVPFSVGFVGKPFTEPELIEIAYAFEQATLLRRPPEATTQTADFDFDGDVDGRDFLAWQRNPGIGELADWQENYGTASIGAMNINVPEPSTFLLFPFALAAILLIARTRSPQSIHVPQFAASLLLIAILAASLHAEIYQWEYINPADPSQGKRQSTTLAPDGAGVDAVPGADLSTRDLTMAYLFGADLTSVNGFQTNLTDADLSHANLSNATFFSSRLNGANFREANLTRTAFGGAVLSDADFTNAEVREAQFHKLPGQGSGITLVQLYSTASYRAHDLSGISVQGSDLTGGNFAGQNLTYASFLVATLTGADFTNAEIRGADFSASFLLFPVPQFGTGLTLAQLYSTADYQAADLSGIGLGSNDLAGGNFADQNLTSANFVDTTLTEADFTNANLGGANLTGANVRRANLANAVFTNYECGLPGCWPIPAPLTDADLTATDARGSDLFTLVPGPYSRWGDFQLVGEGAIAVNMIRPDGHIDGLDLGASGLLIVRDCDGNPSQSLAPIPVTVDQHLAMAPGGTLRMVFETDVWDSIISFAPGIPVRLGGMLELTFADGVNPSSQHGRTFDLFDWTDVTPIGTFLVSSSYRWDLSNLYTTGEVTMLAVPEPGALLMCYVGVIVAVTLSRTASKRHHNTQVS